MPVTRMKVGTVGGSHDGLAERLAEELRANHSYGQPIVVEQEFARTRLLGVKVVWDEFANVGLMDRAGLIRRAYELAQIEGYDRVAFVSGYTVPEAVEAGLLDHWLMAVPERGALPERKAEYITAMRKVGASVLLDPSRPQLRFPSEAQADACKQALLQEVPGSENVWVVGQGIRMFANPDAAGVPLFLNSGG